jgi:Single-stranded DNA-binding protein
MDDTIVVNKAELRGTVCCRPVFSHESRGERFLTFPMEIQRLSGAVDTINILAREWQLAELSIGDETKLHIFGELRSFNNKSGNGSKLVISVLARELELDYGEEVNTIELTGTICKTPTLRSTPMGREICDLMLAVNRRYGRSDYIPCITWGLRARESSEWDVGDTVHLIGRTQSRKYIKNISGDSIEKTAYEVSVIEISLVDIPQLDNQVKYKCL